MDVTLASTASTLDISSGLALNDVFHPSDFTAGSEAAFVHALKLALLAGARLSMLHVGDRSKDAPLGDFPKVRSVLTQWKVLPEGCTHEDVVKAGLRVHKVKTRGSDPAQTIVEHLAARDTDLVVLATGQRRGFSRWLQGSVAEPVARRARIMTLFVPKRVSGFISNESGRVSLTKVLIPIDLDPHPQCALNAVAFLGGLLGCPQLTLTLLHVGHAADAPRVNEPTRGGWSLQTVARDGDVVEEILRCAAEESVDLIAMATQGHRGFLDALRGSTTEQVLRGAPCPVLAVPTA